MLHELLLLQIVVQVGIRQGLREILHNLIDALPHIIPAALGVPVSAGAAAGQGLFIFQVGCRKQDLLIHDIIPELRHHVLALVLDGGEPAEVVQSVVIVNQILLIYLQGSSHHIDDGDGHVADIDDPGVRTQSSAGLGNDGGRVGIVQDPIGRLRVFLHVVDHLDHRENGTHTVGHAAAAAGLLAHAAMAQRNLLVLLSHGIFAHAHLGEDEVRVCVGFLLVVGYGQLDAAFQILVQDPFYQHAQLILALLVHVKETNLVYLQLLLAQSDGFYNSGSKGAAPADNRNNHKAFPPYFPSLHAVILYYTVFR